MNDEAQKAATTTGLYQVDLMDRYWRAANYISVGQIYLLDNPLLSEPLVVPSMSSRDCSAIGARRRASISSTST